jgi:putative FmdB family regulatory protein
MPFYEYRCPDCLTNYVIRRDIHQRDTTAECPECGGVQSARKIALPMVFSMAMDVRKNAVAGGSGCGGCSASSCAGCPSG